MAKKLASVEHLWNISAKNNDHRTATMGETLHAQETKVREVARFLADKSGKDMDFFMKKVGNVTSPLQKFRGLIAYGKSVGIEYR